MIAWIMYDMQRGGGVGCTLRNLDTGACCRGGNGGADAMQLRIGVVDGRGSAATGVIAVLWHTVAAMPAGLCHTALV